MGQEATSSRALIGTAHLFVGLACSPWLICVKGGCEFADHGKHCADPIHRREERGVPGSSDGHPKPGLFGWCRCSSKAQPSISKSLRAQSHLPGRKQFLGPAASVPSALGLERCAEQQVTDRSTHGKISRAHSVRTQFEPLPYSCDRTGVW